MKHEAKNGKILTKNEILACDVLVPYMSWQDIQSHQYGPSTQNCIHKRKIYRVAVQIV